MKAGKVIDRIVSPEFMEEAVPVPPGGTLYVESSRGSVDVRSHDADEVRVEAEARGRNAEHVIFTLETSGDDARFEVRTEGWLTNLFGGPEVRVRLWVPRSYSLALRTSGGDAHVDGVRGHVDLMTSGGDVWLSHTVGQVGLATSGGSVELEHLDGAVRARTSGGHTTLREVFGDVDVRSSGGDLTIDGVDGAVEARLAGGKTSIVFLGDPEGEIRTSGGAVEVLVREEASFDLDARANGGKVKVDLPLDRERSDRSRVSGRRGEKGPRLKLRTNGGDIRVALL
jgi:putative adhesin